MASPATSAELPAPLLAADVDLRDFAFMPLDVVRLRDSQLSVVSTGDEFRAAVLLWCVSWHQVPAGSLPDQDAMLALYAGFGRVIKEWRKVKDGALRGWVKCNDGRWYHPVVCEKAREAWESKTRHQEQREEWRKKKKRQRGSVSGDNADMSQGTPQNVPDDVPRENALKGQGEVRDRDRDRDINTDTDVSGTGADAPAGQAAKQDQAKTYAFSGKLIRLSPQDYKTWSETYHAIPDLRAELTALDAFYDGELAGKDRSKWFIRCSTALANKHQERLKADQAELEAAAMPRSRNGYSRPMMPGQVL